jgi:hypothetical protein
MRLVAPILTALESECDDPSIVLACESLVVCAVMRCSKHLVDPNPVG